MTPIEEVMRGLDDIVRAGKVLHVGISVKLRDLKLVEEFADADGRLRFVTTEALLQRFGLANLQELTTASLLE
jgi:aryl-alcohol dehydrogenase-like predicted oxidoreductase